MIRLEKGHDPSQNASLIKCWSRFSTDIPTLVRDTEVIFHKEAVMPAKQPTMKKTIMTAKGNVVPEWFPLLEQEFENLQKTLTTEVNVRDFGGVGDGVTVNDEAFRRAISTGKRRIFIPAGTYLVTKSIRLPSYTSLVGEGKGRTVIELADSAQKHTILLTNKHHIRGNHHIHVEGMTLDWNADRIPAQEKSASGNNRSSGCTFAHVTFGWIKQVESINAGLHGFDVSSTIYYYIKDGYTGPGRSRYIWLDQLNAHGFGDDGITTHHSDDILITNCHACDPSGRSHKKGFSNSNGIEVDDGSRNVWLVNNTTTRCFGGVEIKAHHNASAASNVTIVGHLSVNDNRAYNFRHIGHHKGNDPDSKTAYNIQAMNLVAVAPIFTSLYEESTPRALVVSAYRNVVINQLTVLGDPEYDFKGHPVIAVQYRAERIHIKNIYIECFKNAKGIQDKGSAITLHK